MSTEDRDIDDRTISAGSEPSDAERTPTTDALAPTPPSAESTPAPSADVKAAPNALSLHDKASNARAVIDKFPGTIGNSPECDLALKGPGAIGVYARLRHERNAFIVEKAHSEIPLVVNEKELRSVILMDGDVLMLGEHEVHVRFTRAEPNDEKNPSKNKRKSRLRIIGAMALVILLLVLVSMAWSRLSGPEVPMPMPAPETNDNVDDVASSGWDARPEPQAEREASPTVDSVPGEPTTAAQAEPSPTVEPIVIPPTIADTLVTNTSDTPSPTVSAADGRSSSETVTGEPLAAEVPTTQANSANTAASNAEPERSNSISQTSTQELAVTAAIEDATHMYTAGNGEQALGRLQQTATQAQETRLQTTRAHIARALEAYRSGLAAQDAGRPFELIRQRDRLAATERTLDIPQRSTYRETLDDAALVAYRAWAQEADSREETADAYAWYQRILSIQPLDAEAARRIDALEQAAKEQYLTGYRLETKDIKSALLYWQRAENMVPKDSRWHRLASEKINDYAYFENRG